MNFRLLPILPLLLFPALTGFDPSNAVVPENEISPEGGIASVRTPSGEPVPVVYPYGLAWQAFHPETSVYRP